MKTRDKPFEILQKFLFITAGQIGLQLYQPLVQLSDRYWSANGTIDLRVGGGLDLLRCFKQQVGS